MVCAPRGRTAQGSLVCGYSTRLDRETALTPEDCAAVQLQVRARVLRWFAACRLSRCRRCARRTQLRLTPLELIDRLAALIPPPRIHRHRYHGVLASNAPLRAQVVALARQPPLQPPKAPASPACACAPAPALWAMLLARIFEILPLRYSLCGAEMTATCCRGGGRNRQRRPLPTTVAYPEHRCPLPASAVPARRPIRDRGLNPLRRVLRFNFLSFLQGTAGPVQLGANSVPIDRAMP
jgi:hypothetical protein